MNYKETIDYIHSAYWTGTKTGLTRTRELLSLLGNPERELRFVHVAGTNGKGSFCAMLSSILVCAGYRTGLYTSPYVNRFNERIAVNGLPIPDEDLAELLTRIRPVVEGMKEKPSEFELITCAAMEYYKEQKCDIVVLEVGMGGEWDSTNVITTPELSVITAMAYDHMQYLGNTMAEIAAAKAGIIKPGGTTLIYGENREAEAVFKKVCEEKHNTLVYSHPERIIEKDNTLQGYTFSYPGFDALHLPLLGPHQLHNAALVLRAVELLREKGWRIPEEAVQKGLKTVHWPARMELLHTQPTVLVDGGHNPQGAQAAASALKNLFPGKKIRFLMGVMADKDVETMVETLLPLGEMFYTVTPHNPRAMQAETLAQRLRDLGAKAKPEESLEKGRHAFLTEAGKEDILCAVGSLYLAGDVRRVVQEYYAGKLNF